MPSFNRSTTGKEVVTAFPSSVAGKTCPSHSSIGAEIALSLAHGSPSHIILLGRSSARIAPVIVAIAAIDPSIRTSLVLVDLASQSSVRSAAAQIKDDASIGQIDAVINCAGIMARPGFEVTEESIEAQFGSNHIGHFLLTNLVLGKVLQAGESEGGTARVVNVSSTGFELGPVRFEDWNFKVCIPFHYPTSAGEGKEYHAWLAYAQSKTANVLFTAALAEKLKSKGVQSFALQPGLIMESNLGKHVTPESWQSALTIANETSGGKEIKMEEPKTLQQGASTALVAALDPSIAEFSGGFLQDCVLRPVEQAYAKGKENADKLWALSEKLVGEKFDL
ncbi:Short-chain dehydrogenase-like protein [Lachnellula subtilissima]|uniref:Short-chain dehydrogenase-like protein n=1 Tax=Lachnellula subtilissima TaxID=602034 RepID=A0A8H8RL93_9HELO|nr:Short-chain dehydrogenase-like protein [Lachnellula subtilissima]